MSVLKTNESPNSRNNKDNGEFTVNGISAFSDNYIWAIESQAYVALVDPGDADVCINYIETCNKSLSSILNYTSSRRSYWGHKKTRSILPTKTMAKNSLWSRR